VKARDILPNSCSKIRAEADKNALDADSSNRTATLRLIAPPVVDSTSSVSSENEKKPLCKRIRCQSDLEESGVSKLQTRTSVLR
jgi:hypothetical protein